MTSTSLISRIVEDLPFSEREARELLMSAPSRYKVHYIEKRNGRGLRQIAQPTAEIKLLQRWAIQQYRNHLPVHSAATAYLPETGIRQHAETHAENSYLLKVDFKDFFPSIKGIDVRRHLARNLGLPSEDLSFLVRLFCWKGKPAGGLRLSIGAPSSPFLSNTIMFDFDQKIEEKCTEHGAVYSRYADDIAISTNSPNSLNEIFAHVQMLCINSKFPHVELNTKKTVFTSKKNQRRLTGLTLTNDGKASLGREKKRLIRAMTHSYSRGILDDERVSTLRGWIAFALSIEPEFVDSLGRMVGELTLAQLKKV